MSTLYFKEHPNFKIRSFSDKYTLASGGIFAGILAALFSKNKTISILGQVTAAAGAISIPTLLIGKGAKIIANYSNKPISVITPKNEIKTFPEHCFDESEIAGVITCLHGKNMIYRTTDSTDIIVQENGDIKTVGQVGKFINHSLKGWKYSVDLTKEAHWKAFIQNS